jgi:hypothetical protein
VRQEEQHLVVPVVGAQRPTVVKDDRLAGAPVLVEDLGAVARFECVLAIVIAPVFCVLLGVDSVVATAFDVRPTLATTAAPTPAKTASLRVG